MGAILECEAGQDPDDERVREGGAEAEKGGLPDGPADGDDEGGHHGLGVTGFEAVQRTEENGHRYIEPGVGGALLQQLREIHAPTLEVISDLSTLGIGLRKGGGFCFLQPA